MNENKPKIWATIIEIILIIAGFAEIILHMSGSNIDGVDILYLGVFGLLIFYALAGYVIPHGNLLKYLMLLFAVAVGIEPVVKGFTLEYVAIISVMCAVAIAYIGGRLNRLNTNIWQMVVVLVVLVGLAACKLFNVGGDVIKITETGVENIIYGFMPAVQWAFITYFYAARFNSHKEEGIKENEELAKLDQESKQENG